MQSVSLKRASALLAQVAVVLIGIVVLAAMLIVPHFEGVNAGATSFREIYFDDPFLAYVYIGSIPFFVALYQAFVLAGAIGKNTLLSDHSVRALRTIQYCAVLLIASVLGAEAYIITVVRRVEEDIAGGIAMGIFAMIIFGVMGAAATIAKRFLQ